MQWLQQNWLWIAFAIGAFFMMTRMGGCGMGFAGGHRSRSGRSDSDAAPPETLFDPVSRRRISNAENPVSTIYRGRAYYFESREDRDAFESDPNRYMAESAGAGIPVAAGRSSHHRHGC